MAQRSAAGGAARAAERGEGAEPVDAHLLRQYRATWGTVK